MSTADVAPKCAYCGSFPHQGICPTVKAIEYHADGTIKRVEFKTANDYPTVIGSGIDWSDPKLTGAAVVDFTQCQHFTVPPRVVGE